MLTAEHRLVTEGADADLWVLGKQPASGVSHVHTRTPGGRYP